MENTKNGSGGERRSDLQKCEPQPLPRTKVQNGVTFHLNEETETYHMVVEEPTLGKYGALYRKYLHENNSVKANHLLARGNYWGNLEMSDARLEKMYTTLSDQMKSKSTEPEDFFERMEWLGRIDAAVDELVMAELNEMILSQA